MSIYPRLSKKKSSSSVFKLLFAVTVATLGSSQSLESTPAPLLPTTTDKAKNDLYGAKMQWVSALGEDAAYSLNAEGATKGYRAAGTIGYAITPVDRVKLSLEHLGQKLGYQFSQGALQKQAMHQEAVGMAYERALGMEWLDAFQAGVFWSKASSHRLDSYLVPDAYQTLHRHLAGCQLWGVSMGPSFKLLKSTSLRLLVNYDQLTVERTFQQHRQSRGVGGTLALCQGLGRGVELHLAAEFRRPFNTYGGALTWDGMAEGLVVGAFGSYTKGRLNLPDTTYFGLQLTYSMGSGVQESSSSTSIQPGSSTLQGWVRSPAIYQPEVLVSAEEDTQLDLS